MKWKKILLLILALGILVTFNVWTFNHLEYPYIIKEHKTFFLSLIFLFILILVLLGCHFFFFKRKKGEISKEELEKKIEDLRKAGHDVNNPIFFEDGSFCLKRHGSYSHFNADFERINDDD